MNKLTRIPTETMDGVETSGGHVVSYFVAPTTKEITEKINEIVDWINANNPRNS